MAEFVDPPITQALAMFQQCLCEQITKAGLPETCFCGVFPGAQAPYIYGDEGQAWVRLVTAGPSRQFPQVDDTWTACDAPITYTLEMAVLRCALPFADAKGNPPTLTQQFETVRLQMADMQAMKQAIMCCVPNDDITVALGAYNPLGPDGGLVGGFWTFSVQF